MVSNYLTAPQNVATRREGLERISQNSIITNNPDLILGEEQTFHKFDQNLSSSKRKAVTVPMLAAASSSQEKQSFESPLLQYLERLEDECRPLSKASASRGFFPTAGLVKGMKIEDGLQMELTPDSPEGIVNTAFQNAQQHSSGGVDSLGHFSLLGILASENFPSVEWTENPGFLSPRSHQIIKHAKRTAARRQFSGSGPWSVRPPRMPLHEVDSCGLMDEWDMQVDRLFSTGEVTLTLEESGA